MTFVNTTKSIICCCRPGNQPAYKQSQEDNNDNKSDITGHSVCAGLEDDDLELAPFENKSNLDEGRDIDADTGPFSESLDERVLSPGEENQKLSVAAVKLPTDGVSENDVVHTDDTCNLDLPKELPVNTSNLITSTLKSSGSGEKNIMKQVSNETKDEAVENAIDQNGDIQEVNVSTSNEDLEGKDDAKDPLGLKSSKSLEISVNPSNEVIAALRSTSKLEDPIVSTQNEVDDIAALSNASNEPDKTLVNVTNKGEVEAIVASRSNSSKLEEPPISAPGEVEVEVEAKVIVVARSTSSISEKELANAPNEIEAKAKVIAASCKSEKELVNATNVAEVEIISAANSSSNMSEVKVIVTSMSTSSNSEDLLANASNSAEAIGTSKSSLVEEEATSSEGNLTLGLASTNNEGKDTNDKLELSKSVSASEAMKGKNFASFEEAEKSIQVESNVSQESLEISLHSDDETKEKDDGLSQSNI